MNQTAQKEGIREFFKRLFGNTQNEEDIEEMAPGEEIDEKTLAILKKSAQEVEAMAKKYSIEKFEVAQKTPKIKKAEVAKTEKQPKQPTVKKQQEREQGESR